MTMTFMQYIYRAWASSNGLLLSQKDVAKANEKSLPQTGLVINKSYLNLFIADKPY